MSYRCHSDLKTKRHSQQFSSRGLRISDGIFFTCFLDSCKSWNGSFGETKTLLCLYSLLSAEWYSELRLLLASL